MKAARAATASAVFLLLAVSSVAATVELEGVGSRACCAFGPALGARQGVDGARRGGQSAPRPAWGRSAPSRARAPARRAPALHLRAPTVPPPCAPSSLPPPALPPHPDGRRALRTYEEEGAHKKVDKEE
jgi:hypothetical protein